MKNCSTFPPTLPTLRLNPWKTLACRGNLYYLDFRQITSLSTINPPGVTIHFSTSPAFIRFALFIAFFSSYITSKAVALFHTRNSTFISSSMYSPTWKSLSWTYPSWAPISRPVNMLPCHADCPPNFKYHGLLRGTGSESLVALHDYILPHSMNPVNITLLHAQIEWPPHRGKLAQRSARERSLDFGGRFGYVGLCGNHQLRWSLDQASHWEELPMLQNVIQPTLLPGLRRRQVHLEWEP